MNILITAGGTRERIDNVRSIANMSTGRLGALIADTFAAEGDVQAVYYIHGPKAALPQTGKAKLFPVEDVAGLERGVRELATRETIDIIVHSMAVSDYRVKSVTSMDRLARAAAELPESLKNVTTENAASVARGWFQAAGDLINRSDSDPEQRAGAKQGNEAGQGGKISSNIEDMILWMERTPKIISLFQTLMPKSILVGFKLLDHAPFEELMDAAYRVSRENNCAFLLANDLAEISERHHRGYLVAPDRSYQTFDTKEEIAAGIVSATMRIRCEK